MFLKYGGPHWTNSQRVSPPQPSPPIQNGVSTKAPPGLTSVPTLPTLRQLMTTVACAAVQYISIKQNHQKYPWNRRKLLVINVGNVGIDVNFRDAFLTSLKMKLCVNLLQELFLVNV